MNSLNTKAQTFDSSKEYRRQQAMQSARLREELRKKKDDWSDVFPDKDRASMFDAGIPAPYEQAKTIIDDLAKTIIEKRDPVRGGMPFREWRQLAVNEIAQALEKAEATYRRKWYWTKVAILGTTCAVITISFWASAYFYLVAVAPK